MTTGRYTGLTDVPTGRIVESRRSMRIVIEMDLPECDWNEVVIPGHNGYGRDDEGSPPITRIEMLESDLHHMMQAAVNEELGIDGDVHTVRIRSGELREYKTFAEL